ncbi:MAG: FCD domain-containing protein [Proteobacteria bacterium]|nr:FCD domain-containing protein [Pseudomonadota bacterium]MBI3499619.1 FCD domain-containing protein [Pseudomonadota bacterium]
MSDVGQDTAASERTKALLKSHSLSGVVQQELERAILSGELAAGTRLNEKAVAAKLGVSRGPIREACRALAALGLVRLVPNRGVFIRQMNQDDAREVYDLRAGLTGLAASLFAARATEAAIGQLRRLLEEMRAAAEAGDFALYSELNLEFHDFIVRSAGNGRLTRSYRGLVKEFQLFRRHGLVESDALIASYREHCAILEAIARRDGQGAYQASFAHVVNGKERMLAALAAAGAKPGS